MRTFLEQLIRFSVSAGKKRCTSPQSRIPRQTSGMNVDFTIAVSLDPDRRLGNAHCTKGATGSVHAEG
jgi:hypothetical protein